MPELSSAAKHEDTLFRNLFEDYERWVRPVEHLSDKIKIKFGLAISQLVDVVSIHDVTCSTLHLGKISFFSRCEPAAGGYQGDQM